MAYSSLSKIITFLILASIQATSGLKTLTEKCDTCKTLVSKFQSELKRTAQGNFGGGNTAWEERKLGTYLNSEIRYEEIFENLCSKDDDACHKLLEDHEDYLLDLFKTHNKAFESILRKTFCIDVAKICCPAEHFGPDCTPCVKDQWNAVCSQNGRCNGDGYREGDGQCNCRYGYEGSLCQNCMSSFYPKRIRTSSVECAACPKECASCLNVTYCASCKNGYQMNAGRNFCEDTNECEWATAVCKENEECVNLPGKYECKEREDKPIEEIKIDEETPTTIEEDLTTQAPVPEETPNTEEAVADDQLVNTQMKIEL